MSQATSNGDRQVNLVDDKILNQPWILDSGAGVHSCPHKIFFDTYSPVAGDGICAVSITGSTCQAVGVGSVKFKMFDGAVRKFSGVWHFPEAKFNLISVGFLESRGHDFQTKDGVMTVNRDSSVVMKAERNKHNIYYLIGKAVLGGGDDHTAQDDGNDDHPVQHQMAKLVEKEVLGGGDDQTTEDDRKEDDGDGDDDDDRSVQHQMALVKDDMMIEGTAMAKGSRVRDFGRMVIAYCRNRMVIRGRKRYNRLRYEKVIGEA